VAKFLFFSDLHLANWTQHAHISDRGLNTRLEDQLKILAQIANIAEAEKVDAIFCLGDVFHSRIKVDVDVGFCGYLSFKALAEVAPLFILVGNHDQNSRDGSIHSLEPFKAFAEVIDRPRTDMFPDGTKVAAHPFTADTDEFVNWLSKREEDLVLFHQGIDKATTGAFDIAIKAEISVDSFPTKPKLFLAGHYHKHQWVIPNRCAYIGSPLQLDFGERTEEKGCLLLDTATWQTEFKPLKAPRFFLFESGVADNGGVEAFHEAVRKGQVDPDVDFIRVTGSANNLSRSVIGNYPRVQVVTKAKLDAFNADLAKDEALNIVRVDPKRVSTDRELMTAYMELRQPDPDLDRNKLMDLGLSYLQDAK
jgi:DNA repair exonuclease SbcCD nuclease subunit